MIAHLTGTIILKKEHSIVLNVNNIGFEIAVASLRNFVMYFVATSFERAFFTFSAKAETDVTVMSEARMILENMDSSKKSFTRNGCCYVRLR